MSLIILKNIPMKKRDGRKLSHEISEFIREEAVKRVIKGKESPEVVIKSYGLARWNIYKWLKIQKEQGWKGLKSKKAKGKTPKITQVERKRLQKWLMKNPQQLHFDFGLWTLEIIQALIKREFKKDVSLWTVSRILKSIGYTKQKPLYRAWQQDPKKVEQWLKVEYPRIKKEAKKENRSIWFEDEAGFRSTDHRGTTWSKKGKTPIVRTTGARFGCNSVSAVNKRGELRFMLFEGTFTTHVFINFLKRLLEGNKENITLIVDGHPTHKTKKVKEFVDSTHGKLKIEYLPPYSPELNPDEQVWLHTKGKVERKGLGGPNQFKESIRSKLHSLQKRKDIIQSFFSHPDVIYTM